MAISLTFGALAPVWGASAKPNFVVFLIDDLGWGAMSAYGHTLHETPHFDALCQRGMRFTNAYSACTVCSPSRAALLTGKHPARLHLTDWIAGHERPDAKLIIPEWKQEISPEETTLPEALRQHGYRTAFIGKWHLVPQYKHWTRAERTLGKQQHMPKQHGFDFNIGGREWGQPKGRGRYFYPYQMPGLQQGQEGEYLTDRLTDESLQFVEQAGDQPFLLYLSHYAVHTPIMAKADAIDHFRRKTIADKDEPASAAFEADADVYAAMHQSVDESVGRIVKKLHALGKLENTVILFTGDNGGDRHSACGGLRGRKGTAFEGGVRVPTCLVWPGGTQPGSVCDTPIYGADYFPTFLELAGLPLLPEQHADGVSLAPLLKQTGSIDRPALYWHYPHYHRTTPYGAIRRGDWKLIEYFEDSKLVLFNLTEDPFEQFDLAKNKPEIAQQLLAQLRAWRESVGAQMPTVGADSRITH